MDFRPSLGSALFHLLTCAVLIGVGCGGGGGGGSGTTNRPQGSSPTAVIESGSAPVAGLEIWLNGTESSGSGATSDLAYEWTLAKPAGSSASLTSTTAPVTSFTADVAGDFQVTLVVVEDGLRSSPAMRTFAVQPNQPPEALATATPPTLTARRVRLDASGSSDPELQALTYRWTLVSKPAGSSATLPAGAGTATIEFITDMPGSYAYSLVVNDGIDDSAPFHRTVVVDVAQINYPPQAGVVRSSPLMPLVGAVSQAVLLDGRASSDADAQPLTYQWTLVAKPAGSSVALVDATKSVAKIVPDVLGEYTVQLVVKDKFVNSAPVTALVSVEHFFHPLPFRVTDAEQSKSLGRLVLVSADSSTLHQFDLATAAITDLELPLAPIAVSVAPDGLFAAVGHDGWISYVDLVANTVVKTFAVTTTVADVVLAGNGYVHAFPGGHSWEQIHSVNVAAEVETLSSYASIGGSTLAELHPDGTAIYGADNNSSPSDIEKYDVSAGPAAPAGDSPYHGDYEMCGDLWIAEDGLRIFTRCGNVFRASTNPAQDMTYAGSLPGVDRIQDLAHTSEAGKIALVPRVYDFGTDPDPLADTKVAFFDADFLTPERTVSLPGFPVATTTHLARGRFVFYTADGSRYAVVEKADSASGLLLDYGVLLSAEADGLLGNGQPVAHAGVDQAVALGNPLPLDATSSADPDGDALTYAWSVVSRPAGSSAVLGDATLASPSFVPDALGAYVLALTVSDGSLSSAEDRINVTAVGADDEFLLKIRERVVDAEYSAGLDRIVHVASQPDRLYTFDAHTYERGKVDLPLAPTAVSVAPDGLFAAVGHNGWISYVDLTSNSLVKTFPVATDVLDLVLDGNGNVHVFPRRDQWSEIHSVNVATEVETLSTGWMIYAGTLGELHPNGTAIYGADNGLSPSDIEKYDVTSGTAHYVRDSPYHGDYGMCGDLWISEDGLRIFTRCGNVFRASNDPGEDMTYNGKLPGVGWVVSLSHSSETDKVAVIRQDQPYFGMDPLRDTELEIFDYDFLTPDGTVSLPHFPAGSMTYPSHGRFVFFSADGSQLFAIVEADAAANAAEDFGIAVLSPE